MIEIKDEDLAPILRTMNDLNQGYTFKGPEGLIARRIAVATGWYKFVLHDENEMELVRFDNAIYLAMKMRELYPLDQWKVIE